MGFSRKEYWTGLPFPSPGDLPDPGIKPMSPTLAGRLYHWATRKAYTVYSVQLSSVQSLSHVWLFATPWTAARQASLSITNSRVHPNPCPSSLMMSSNHLSLCRPLLLLPSVFRSIRVFSNESAFCIRWPKYWRKCTNFKCVIQTIFTYVYTCIIPICQDTQWLQHL